MGNAAILDFVVSKIWRHRKLRPASIYPHTKFGEDISKGGRVMAIYVFSLWRPPPSWIYFRCRFLSYNQFWIVATYVPAKFLKAISTGGWVIEFCQKFKMAALRHFELLLGNAGPPTKSTCWRQSCVQISLRSTLQFRRYAQPNILQIWLKTPIHASKNSFWGLLTPKHYFAPSRPQKAIPCVKTRTFIYWS